MENENRTLVEAAKAMLPLAFAPFSGFHVGAAILGADGNIYTGCNVESSSYGACICAERTAAVKAVSCGCRHFKKIAVISDGPDLCTPCGICRQFLLEFSDDMTVLCCRNDGSFTETTLESLLPMGFRLDKV